MTMTLRAAMLGTEWYQVSTGADGYLVTELVPHREHVARCRTAVPDATEHEIETAISEAERYARWRDEHVWPLLYDGDGPERRA